jgi:hypothetical protein
MALIVPCFIPWPLTRDRINNRTKIFADSPDRAAFVRVGDQASMAGEASFVHG